MTADGSSAQPDGDEPRILALRSVAAVGDLVATAVTMARRDCPAVRIICDVDPRLAAVGDPRLFGRLLADLVQQAALAAVIPDPHSDLPPLREVVITAVETGAAVEIEVADSGATRRGVSGDLEAVAARLGGTLGIAACPEGGTAVTLRLPRGLRRRMAA